MGSSESEVQGHHGIGSRHREIVVLGLQRPPVIIRECIAIGLVPHIEQVIDLADDPDLLHEPGQDPVGYREILDKEGVKAPGRV